MAYESESNNTMGTADLINSNEDMFGFITLTSDVDWFKFTLSNKGYINLYLGSIPVGTDYDLYLYNSSGIELWAGINSSNTSELLSNKLLNAGTYYAKVKSYSGSHSTDSYLLRWRLVKIWPVLESERITQVFKGDTHKGIDIGGSTPGVEGDTIVAFYDGTVIRSGWSDSYGNVVYISHNIDGKNVQSRYAHLRDSALVTVGQIVIAGTKLGYMGNTGESGGVHLHFETRDCGSVCDTSNNSVPFDPLTYFPEYV